MIPDSIKHLATFHLVTRTGNLRRQSQLRKWNYRLGNNHRNEIAKVNYVFEGDNFIKLSVTVLCVDRLQDFREALHLPEGTLTSWRNDVRGIGLRVSDVIRYWTCNSICRSSETLFASGVLFASVSPKGDISTYGLQTEFPLLSYTAHCPIYLKCAHSKTSKLHWKVSF